MKIVKIPDVEQYIKPIKLLSPSMYTNILNGCAYQFVLDRAVYNCGVAAKLPPNLNAIIGTITHRLFEERVKGLIMNAEDFKNKWKILCKEQENCIRNNYPTLVNFTIADYDKMFKALRLAMKMVSEVETSNCSHTSTLRPTLRPTECPVIIPGLLKGSIDLVKKDGEEYQLIDYKTGNCYDNEGNIKQAYIDQLNLYSIMFEYQFGVHVSKLTIIDNNGKEIDIPFSNKTSEEILNEVRHSIDRINNSICSQQYHSLASLSKDNCSWCSCRHICNPFLNSTLCEESNIFVGQAINVFGNDTIQLELTNGSVIRIMKMQPLYIEDWNDLVGRNFIFINLCKRPTEIDAYTRQSNTIIFEF